MKKTNYWLAYFLMVVLQILVCNYCNFSQYVMLSILPVIVLLVPIRYSTILTMIVAFATGMAVDLIAEGGLLGLNAVALVPVAFCRNKILDLVFGEELFARKEDISIERFGIMKMSMAILLAQTIFFLIYNWTDGAGTRPFWFNLVRFLASSIVSYAVSLILASFLSRENRSGWR